jgi:hypothetical protein
MGSSNDLTASPITEFVSRCIGRKGTAHALAQARKMFEGTMTALASLESLERTMVRAIAGACSHISLSRREALGRSRKPEDSGSIHRRRKTDPSGVL